MANCLVDLSSGTCQNLRSTTLTMGPNSLLIVPAGFDLSTGVASNSTFNLTHTAGTTLVVPAGNGFAGSGTINDPVDCQGTISAAASGSHDINGGLMLSGTGQVNLGNGNFNTGSGSITTNDAISTMSGGSLSASFHYVGSAGTGSFTQSGGTNASFLVNVGAGGCGTYNLGGNGVLTSGVNVGEFGGAGIFNLYGNGLFMGYAYVGDGGTGTFNQSGGTNLGSCTVDSYGTYNLSGNGLMTGDNVEYVGYSGTGFFAQSGGTNSTGSRSLYLAFDGGAGTYNLSGSGLLVTQETYVSYQGQGTFNQSGGTHTTASLCLGEVSGSGTYNFSGGMLILNGPNGSLSGLTNAAFNFTGGTLQASGTGIVGIYVPLNGAATIDTNGRAMTIQQLVTTSGVTDLNFDLTAPAARPRLRSARATSPNPNTTISFGTDPTTPGDYPLIGGTIGAPLLSDFVLPATPAGEQYSLVLVAGNIKLVVAAIPEPSTFVLLAAGAVGLLGCDWRRKRATQTRRLSQPGMHRSQANQ